MNPSDELFPAAETTSFYCAIHGTVTACPWRFMSCTEPATKADAADIGAGMCTRCWFRHSPRCTESKAQHETDTDKDRANDASGN